MSGKKFPEWYVKKREESKRLLREARPAKYGPDIDLSMYSPNIAPEHRAINSLRKLRKVDQEEIKKVGQRPDEGFRSGSHLQIDDHPVYLSYTDWTKQSLFPKFPEGLVVLDTREAIRKYPWIEKFWFKIIPLRLDKYTSYIGANEAGGVFVWVKRGTVIGWPVQSCFYVRTENYVQVPHNLIIAEPYSRIHLITGCVVAPECSRAAHIAATEIYVGKGAEVTWTMIHNWNPEFEARPKIGIVVEENGTYMENFILLSPVRNTQFYPTAVLRGNGARASFHLLIFGRGESNIDAGSGIIFNAEKTRGEIISRAVVTDKASVKMRGLLHANKPNTRGHLECRALMLSDEARAYAYPNLRSFSSEAELTHEAAIGKIAEEQLYYLMSRGLSKGEATSMIARGFLDTEIPGLPTLLQGEISRLVSMTAEEVM